MSQYALELTDDTFEQEVINNKGVVLVDFWASWCMPCLALAPVVEKLAEEMKDVLKVCKLNVDENQKISAEFNIMSIPTLILFKDGKELDRIIGAIGQNDLMRRIRSHIG